MMQKKIYYHHTDAGGVVYYATYLNFLEEARTEFLKNIGISVKELSEKGILFVVSRQEIDYKAPASYGDILHIGTRVSNISKVRIEFEYVIKNQDGKLVCKAKTIMACIDKDFKIISVPEAIRVILTKT